MVRALDILEAVVLQTQRPSDLLVLLAEQVAQADADPKRVLCQVLSAGKLGEENAPLQWAITAARLKSTAPHLFSIYQSLTPRERQKFDIVDMANLGMKVSDN